VKDGDGRLWSFHYVRKGTGGEECNAGTHNGGTYYALADCNRGEAMVTNRRQSRTSGVCTFEVALCCTDAKVRQRLGHSRADRWDGMIERCSATGVLGVRRRAAARQDV
jgi:hypothetical protein